VLHPLYEAMGMTWLRDSAMETAIAKANSLQNRSHPAPSGTWSKPSFRFFAGA
jgi:hypothetical protein